MAYTVLNARVKQKLATEAYWISIEDELGVIFEGEQAFVYNEEGQPVNFKIGDGTKKFSELPYFIAYYTGVTAQKILTFLAQTGNITVPSVFKNNTLLQDIAFINNSGSPITMLIGTTNGGSELGSVTLSTGASTIGLKKQFTGATTVYFTGLTVHAFSMFVLYYQLDEAPAIPPSSSGSSVSFAYGTIYAFSPMYPGQENVVWDFTTGDGVAGTQYEGCTLLAGWEDVYLKGYKSGDTIGGDTGSADNAVVLTEDNIPKIQLKIFSQSNGGGQLVPSNLNGNVAWTSNHTSGNQDYDMKVGSDGATAGNTSTFGKTTPDGINLRPKSKVVLYFTGPVSI